MIFATNPTSTFDSFSANFMGLDSIENSKHEYRALMEVTSYFWDPKEAEVLYWKRFWLPQVELVLLTGYTYQRYPIGYH
jgi:hypothetical protein